MIQRKLFEKYFVPRNVDVNDDYYDFKEEYNTEKKIQESLKELPEDKRARYKACLFQLIANVLLVEES